MPLKTVYDPITNTTTTKYVEDTAQNQAAPQPSFESITAETNKILGGSYFDTKTGQQLQTYTPPSNIQTINSQNTMPTTTPTLPAPIAPTKNEILTTSAQAEADNLRKQLQDSYKAQQDRIASEAKTAQAKIDNLSALQQTEVLGNVENLTQPFRENLEKTERQRLYVDENFQANQKLTNELDSLLTEGNEIIKRQKAEGGLASVATANLNKTISDINARSGVIQAVMSARNGQISQAYNLIDRTVDAINADRQDRIDYYKTLYNFYGDQKATEANKLTALNADERKYINAQIGLLESEMSEAKQRAETIKNAMTDPDTALTYASAGITLNDSVQQINEKLAKYAYTKEIQDNSNEMAKAGYKAVVGAVPAGADVRSFTDSKGVTRQYYKTMTEEERLRNEKLRLETSKLSGTQSERPSEITTAYNIANQILNSGNIGSITGVPGISAIIPGSATQYTINQYKQLQALLSLENRQKLKGSGAISDYESRVLNASASALGRNLSAGDFEKELKKIRGVLATSAGYPVAVKVINALDGSSKVGTLDRDGIESAVSQGFVIEYQ